MVALTFLRSYVSETNSSKTMVQGDLIVNPDNIAVNAAGQLLLQEDPMEIIKEQVC